MIEDIAAKPEYYNTEDPITIETLAELSAEQLYGLTVGDKLYGFNIDSLFQWARKTRNSNPITNLPLSSLDLAFITDKYLQVHTKDGVMSIQINSSQGWDYGLITIMVGDFGQQTLGDLTLRFAHAIAEAGIQDFGRAVHPLQWNFIYAGRMFPSHVKLIDIPGFVPGHKITVSE